MCARASYSVLRLCVRASVLMRTYACRGHALLSVRGARAARSRRSRSQTSLPLWVARPPPLPGLLQHTRTHEHTHAHAHTLTRTHTLTHPRLLPRAAGYSGYSSAASRQWPMGRRARCRDRCADDRKGPPCPWAPHRRCKCAKANGARSGAGATVASDLAVGQGSHLASVHPGGSRAASYARSPKPRNLKA
jgi:hypothetical protein